MPSPTLAGSSSASTCPRKKTWCNLVPCEINLAYRSEYQVLAITLRGEFKIVLCEQDLMTPCAPSFARVPATWTASTCHCTWCPMPLLTASLVPVPAHHEQFERTNVYTTREILDVATAHWRHARSQLRPFWESPNTYRLSMPIQMPTMHHGLKRLVFLSETPNTPMNFTSAVKIQPTIYYRNFDTQGRVYCALHNDSRSYMG